ncbi:histidine kinase [Hungatella hominis]|uniref:Stage 0 sporulation protein A homolog n=1 Tax=Hungatella hominis TaxID=2763050 RepID=A0ABR7H9Q7_9FIRM|nr:histidine kinase [Hungatella hominis]MBC5709892.1 histidine kinase [Hungatella hominis]
MKLEKNYNNYEPEQEYLLSQMDGYLNEINRYVKNVGEYSGIYMSTIEQYNVSVSIYVLIKNALNSLEAENIRWDYRERNLEKNLEGKLITGDPFQLIDANRKILEFLCHYRKNNRLDIETVIGDDSVEILFGITIDQIKRRELHRISRIFSKKTFVSSLVEQELVPISIAKQSIEQNHGKICFEQSGDQLSISYRLMLAEEKKKPEAEPEIEKAFSDAAYHVVLISALPQQIELIEEYLIYENYDVKTFSSASEALRYIEGTRDINIVIAGDMFGEMDALSVCMEIRKEYALEQLPILMISHEKQRVLKMEPFLYVNDIIYEPFEYITLMQKLHSLIILQESAKESMLSRLDFLQAQMDPHFIFNTISTIMPLCMEEPEEAYRLLGYFSEYLRGSLYHKGLNTTILLEQELELIHAYLNIQEVRFSHMIRYILVNEVDETVKILPLIVEPIVENSVKHGRITGKELLIRMEIRREGNGIRFIIEDNGKGMSEEKVQAVLQDNSEEISNGSYSIGLMNLRKRLQIYYQSVLRIESSEGEGTKISFTIPSDSVR